MDHPKVTFDYLILDRSNILICLFSDTYLWVDIFVYLILLTRYLLSKCGNIVSGVIGNHKVIDGSLFFNLVGTPWFKAPHSFMISLHFYYTWRYLFDLSTFNSSCCEIRLWQLDHYGTYKALTSERPGFLCKFQWFITWYQPL